MFSTNYDPESRTWYGQPTAHTYHPNVSVAQVVLNAMSRRPHHIGQVNEDNGVRLSNRTLRLNAIRAAEHLSLMGIGAGDVLALIAKNHHYVSAVLIAGMALAAPVNTLDPNFTSEEMEHMLHITEPKVIFCDADNIARVRKALRTLARVVPIFTFDRKVDGARLIDDLLHETGTEEEFLPTVLHDGSRQTAAIICSSGTTGPPKGVSLSHAMLLEQMSKVFSLQIDDVLLCFSSLYWISGLMCLLSGAMRGLTRIVTTNPFSPQLMLQCITKYHVSIVMSAPSHLGALLQHPQMVGDTDWSNLRAYFIGGGALSADMRNRINVYLPADVLCAYGMSEVSGIISCDTKQSAHEAPDSVGMLMDGMRARVLAHLEVDEESEEGAADADDGDGAIKRQRYRRCGIGEDGEISVQLRPPFVGYWRNDEATAATMTSGEDRSDEYSTDEDADEQTPWFRTGDIGHFDEAGHLIVVDRLKDLLKYNSVQVSPSEVEAVVQELPGIAGVCVVGIADPEVGDLPAAVVVRAHGDTDVSEEDIVAIVAERLSDAKHLRGGVYFVEKLPTTYSGKVLRRKAKEIATEMYNARRAAEEGEQGAE